MKNEAFKVFLYARRSSDERSDKQLQSIPDQIDVLKPLAARLGVRIVAILEESKSAKEPYVRPIFTDMLARIEAGEADGILTWHPNRLFRNPVDEGSVIWMLQNAVIKKIITPAHTYHPQDSVLLLSLEGAMANQYSRDLSNAVKRGLTRKAKNKNYPGVAQQGYYNFRDGDFAEMRVDEERWDSVRKMWKMLLSGNYTVPQIRNIANNDWGYRTPKKRRKGGGPLGQNSLYKIFTNLIYAGLFIWKGEIYEGSHKPMITVEEFDRAQILLGRKGKPRPQTHEAAYTGLIRCGECGHLVTCSIKRKLIKQTGKIKFYTYYHCHKKKRDANDKAVCSQKPIRLEDLEAQISAELIKYTISPAFKKWTFEKLCNQDEEEVHERNQILDQQRKSYDAAQKELDSLRTMRIRQLIDDDEYMEERSKLKTNRAKIKMMMNSTDNRTEVWDELTDQAFDFVSSVKSEFDNGSISRKREIFSALGSNFVLEDKKASIKAAKWLVPMAKLCPTLDAEFTRLELDKNIDIATRNEQLAQLIILMRAVVSEVRTEIERMNQLCLSIPKITGGWSGTQNPEPSI